MDSRILSIGTLAQHPLWDEKSSVRTPHATTTLVRSDDMVMLVNPALPATVLQARLSERCGLEASDVTHVFLTSFLPDHRLGLELFGAAQWLVSEVERESIGVLLIEQYQQAEQEEEADLAQGLKRDIALLQRCLPAPDQFAAHVDLFPLPGHTPGTTGLILSYPQYTTVITGDAVPTIEHFEAGQVLSGCYDLEKARASFSEVMEIADVVVPGRDNMFLNMTRGLF
ncbi:MAG: MBL fold metallo-hydrolase [Planctomycetes bacterium]|nr:MBL fold metallo-hydrolase [Planctomycetota bacterium]NOG54700.1 MBL fold metallo-hydrolase [Planctomycetota bacterium]